MITELTATTDLQAELMALRARCAALERNRLQHLALLDAYAEVTPMPWRVRLAKERARIADKLAQALEAA